MGCVYRGVQLSDGRLETKVVDFGATFALKNGTRITPTGRDRRSDARWPAGGATAARRCWGLWRYDATGNPSGSRRLKSGSKLLGKALARAPSGRIWTVGRIGVSLADQPHGGGRDAMLLGYGPARPSTALRYASGSFRSQCGNPSICTSRPDGRSRRTSDRRPSGWLRRRLSSSTDSPLRMTG